MGARLMKRWIAMPLKDINPMKERLDAVETLIRDTGMRNELEEQIARIGDLERLISRVAVGRIVPREVIQLKDALAAIVPVKEMCSSRMSLTAANRRTAESLPAYLRPD